MSKTTRDEAVAPTDRHSYVPLKGDVGTWCGYAKEGGMTCGLSASAAIHQVDEAVALKPCPFKHSVNQGSLADDYEPYSTDSLSEDSNWCVCCPVCKSATGYYDTEQEARKAWNARADKQAARHDKLIANVGSKLTAENEINSRLYKKGDGSVDALCHYSDGRRDALIWTLELLQKDQSVLYPTPKAEGYAICSGGAVIGETLSAAYDPQAAKDTPPDFYNPNARHCAVCTERLDRVTWHLPPLCTNRASANGQWQGIETALRDGSWQIIGRIKGSKLLWWYKAKYAKGLWKTNGGTAEPTHWMPLPAPPAAPAPTASEKCSKCGHNNLGKRGYCQQHINATDGSDCWECNCQCVFAAPTADKEPTND